MSSEKTVSFDAPSRLRIEYELANRSPFEFKYIWAAHPLLNIEPGSRLLLPGSARSVINVLQGSRRLGRYGNISSWPIVENEEGTVYDLSVADPDSGLCEKYYVFGELPDGGCALYHPSQRHFIRFGYPPDIVRYLGVWSNENGPFLAQQNIAPEPCTGALDAIDMADRFGMVSRIGPYEKANWHLTIETGAADGPGGILE